MVHKILNNLLYIGTVIPGVMTLIPNPLRILKICFEGVTMNKTLNDIEHEALIISNTQSTKITVKEMKVVSKKKKLGLAITLGHCGR